MRFPGICFQKKKIQLPSQNGGGTVGKSIVNSIVVRHLAGVGKRKTSLTHALHLRSVFEDTMRLFSWPLRETLGDKKLNACVRVRVYVAAKPIGRFT